MNNTRVLETAIKGRDYVMWQYPWNAFNTQYDSKDYLKLREGERESFFNRVNQRPYIDSESIYRFHTSIDTLSVYEDAVDNIDKILNIHDTFKRDYMSPETNKPLNYPTTILLRGNYSIGRNLFVKQMGMYDLCPLLVRIDGFKRTNNAYHFSVFPTFNTIITGFFTEDRPFNGVDKWYFDGFTIQDHLDILEFIHTHEDFKHYNVIIDGNKFQPYMNRVKNLITPLDDKRRYFDMYILNDYLLHYLTDPINMCHYKKYGWNKYPYPDDEYCTLFDNLRHASKNGIKSFYLPFDKNPDNTLFNLLTGKFTQIEHYMNKPILP